MSYSSIPVEMGLFLTHI